VNVLGELEHVTPGVMVNGMTSLPKRPMGGAMAAKGAKQGRREGRTGATNLASSRDGGANQPLFRVADEHGQRPAFFAPLCHMHKFACACPNVWRGAGA